MRFLFSSAKLAGETVEYSPAPTFLRVAGYRTSELRFIASTLRDRWSGTLVLVGQPAEEIGAGARTKGDGGI